MRTAKVLDYWRGVYRTTYPVRVDQLAFSDVVGIGSGAVTFAGGITAICGGNGVGKSTLLFSLFRSLIRLEKAGEVGTRFLKAKLTASLTTNLAALVVETTFDPPTRGVHPDGNGVVEINHLDSGRLSQQLSSFFLDTPDLPELLEPYTPRELTPDELETLNYVVGKNYSRCRITEIVDYEEPGEFPYFEVTHDGVIYGSEMMGLGELALHITLWQLGRLDDHSILLMEEPEAHVSPRSQQNLLNVIAREAARKKLWVVITTHSAGIVARIPREHIRLIYRAGAGIGTIANPTEAQLNLVVGQVNTVRVIALTEDGVSTTFAREWLGRVAPEVVQHLDIRKAGSTSAIDTVLGAFPQTPESIRILALYDGDQRGAARAWPHAYLPGTTAPERVLMATVGDGLALAEVLGRDHDTVRFVLDQLQGLDHHDWVRELAQHLSMPVEGMIAALTEVWIGTDEGRTQSEAALQELRAAAALSL